MLVLQQTRLHYVYTLQTLSSYVTPFAQYCLRIDIPVTWANPNSQKFILCFKSSSVYSRAARSIRRAQFAYFESIRLSSQSSAAIQSNELEAAGSLGMVNAEGSQSLTQDIKVKEGDDEAMLKSVSVDGEVVVIELKTKTMDRGMRSKRSIISTVGIPIQFVDPLSIVLPSRVTDVTFTFPDSLQRDLFAYKVFLHSKGHPNFESGVLFDSVHDGTNRASLSVMPGSGRSGSIVSRYFSANVELVNLVFSFGLLSFVDYVSTLLLFVIRVQGVASEKSLYKQGFLNKQVASIVISAAWLPTHFQGAFVKSWKTRYFVLRPGDLSYFKVQTSFVDFSVQPSIPATHL